MWSTAVEEKYYKVDEVAKRLRVTRQAVYNWIDEGRLRAVKVGSALRVSEAAIQDFVKPAEPGDRDEKR